MAGKTSKAEIARHAHIIVQALMFYGDRLCVTDDGLRFKKDKAILARSGGFAPCENRSDEYLMTVTWHGAQRFLDDGFLARDPESLRTIQDILAYRAWCVTGPSPTTATDEQPYFYAGGTSGFHKFMQRKKLQEMDTEVSH